MQLDCRNISKLEVDTIDKIDKTYKWQIAT